ncbi:hypothetical protein NDU88_007535 [Pleurodeles waltl]|uniref:Uncharacterized protein n=1 Tax=Pleurodeles waltl TaxID=8319 RepID=A0AAV7NWI9_PLEWA|nr:hypothetical protein NDU88_007535 [Pleurodeles waltl]
MARFGTSPGSAGSSPGTFGGAVRPSGPPRAWRAAHLQRLSGGGPPRIPALSRAGRLHPQPPIWSAPRRRGGRREGGGRKGPPPWRCGSRFAVGRGGRGSLPVARLPALSPRLRSLFLVARSAASAVLRHFGHSQLWSHGVRTSSRNAQRLDRGSGDSTSER